MSNIKIFTDYPFNIYEELKHISCHINNFKWNKVNYSWPFALILTLILVDVGYQVAGGDGITASKIAGIEGNPESLYGLLPPKAPQSSPEKPANKAGEPAFNW